MAATTKIALAVMTGGLLSAQVYLSTLPAGDYLQAAPGDAAARLARSGARIDSLGALLKSFDISTDSQALVFSKTSLQSAKISPRNPRAVYFNDQVAVGYIRGSDIFEIAAVDPAWGVRFYRVENDRIEPREVCLRCHQGAATMGVPGIFIGSVFPDAAGNPGRAAAIITDHRTPFADRWGGWYVNAAHGEQPDRANGVAADPAEPHHLNARQNLTTLIRDFNPAGYPEPTSDIVALMTFEHQTQMINLMTRVGWLARMGQPLDSDIDALVRYMTFADEAPLKEPIEGVSTFTKTFPRRGPRDSKGRSLRDFDLQTRLFRYPLSYLIYSPQFDALPEAVRERIWRGVAAALKDRPEALDIVRETKAGI